MSARLYQEDVYLKEWEAEVISVEECGADPSNAGALLYDVQLGRTAFFPEGGGQSCDTGSIGGFPVVDVQEREDSVIHTIRVSAGEDLPAPGSTLPCRTKTGEVSSGWATVTVAGPV